LLLEKALQEAVYHITNIVSKLQMCQRCGEKTAVGAWPAAHTDRVPTSWQGKGVRGIQQAGDRFKNRDLLHRRNEVHLNDVDWMPASQSPVDRRCDAEDARVTTLSPRD